MKRLALALFLLNAWSSALHAQQIRGWNYVAVPPFERDSCAPIPDRQHLTATLTAAGWHTSPLPAVDWTRNTVLLVSSLDSLSRPGSIASDGSRLYLRFARDTSRNSGVFLVILDTRVNTTACQVVSTAATGFTGSAVNTAATHSTAGPAPTRVRSSATTHARPANPE